LYKKIQDLKQTGSIFNKQEAFKPASSQSTAFQQKCMNYHDVTFFSVEKEKRKEIGTTISIPIQLSSYNLI